MNATNDAIDTADHVKHGPSGEEWLVARATSTNVYPCGWPPSRAELADCTLIKKATPDERQKLLQELAAGRSENAGWAKSALAAQRSAAFDAKVRTHGYVDRVTGERIHDPDRLGAGSAASGVLGTPETADGATNMLRRIEPLLAAVAGGERCSMAAGDLLRDVRSFLAAPGVPPFRRGSGDAPKV